MGLVITGFPLKYSDTDWAKAISSLMGGSHVMGMIHRFLALVTFLYAGIHAAFLAWFFTKKCPRPIPQIHLRPGVARLQPARPQGLYRHGALVLLAGAAPQARPLGLLRKVRLLGRDLGRLRHRRHGADPLDADAVHAHPAGLGPQLRHGDPFDRGAPRGLGHFPGSLLQHPHAPGEVSDRYGDADGPDDRVGNDGRAARWNTSG